MVPNEETVAKAKEWLKIVTDGGELKDVTEENQFQVQKALKIWREIILEIQETEIISRQ